MSTLRTNNIGNVAGTATTDVLNVINGSAKAWVNFNGTGTIAIRGSHNVSSVSDNGVGTYTVNMTTALANTNFCVVATKQNASVQTNTGIGEDVASRTTSAVRVVSIEDAVGTDSQNVSVVVMR